VLVVDASIVAVAVAVALGDDGADGDGARTRLRDQRLSAPELIDLEIVSVLRHQLLAGQLDVRRAPLACRRPGRPSDPARTARPAPTAMLGSGSTTST
jgi:hypothetical protein